MVDDQFADGKIGEVEGLIEQLAEGSLSCSGSASDDDVGCLAWSVLGYHGCWYGIIMALERDPTLIINYDAIMVMCLLDG